MGGIQSLLCLGYFLNVSALIQQKQKKKEQRKEKCLSSVYFGLFEIIIHEGNVLINDPGD